MDIINPFFLMGVAFSIPPWGQFGNFGLGVQYAGLAMLLLNLAIFLI